MTDKEQHVEMVWKLYREREEALREVERLKMCLDGAELVRDSFVLSLKTRDAQLDQYKLKIKTEVLNFCHNKMHRMWHAELGALLHRVLNNANQTPEPQEPHQPAEGVQGSQKTPE